MLRMATPEDTERVLELSMNFFEAAKLPYGEVNEAKARNVIEHCRSPLEPTSVLILWEEQGKVQGLLAGQLTETLLNTDKVATELIWWVEPEYRKGEAGKALLGAFEYWAEWNNCRYVQMIGLQNEYSKTLDRYYRKEGFHIAETTYIKELN